MNPKSWELAMVTGIGGRCKQNPTMLYSASLFMTSSRLVSSPLVSFAKVYLVYQLNDGARLALR
jgi:hypothetical protein